MSSPTFLPPIQLMLAQQLANSTLLSPCTISRDGAPFSPQPRMPDGSALRCSVATATTRIHLGGTPPGSYVPEWAVTLPAVSSTGAYLSVVEGDVISVPSGAGAGLYTTYDTISEGTYPIVLLVSTYKAPLEADAIPGTFPYLQHNATVSVTRGGVAVPTSQHILVVIVPPKQENMSPEGVQLSTTILAGPGTSWRAGDIVTVEHMDGFVDLDQITKSEVLSASRQPGLAPEIHVFVRGTLQ